MSKHGLQFGFQLGVYTITEKSNVAVLNRSTSVFQMSALLSLTSYSAGGRKKITVAFRVVTPHYINCFNFRTEKFD